MKLCHSHESSTIQNQPTATIRSLNRPSSTTKISISHQHYQWDIHLHRPYTGVGKCPNWTSPYYWGCIIQQIFEGDVKPIPNSWDIYRPLLYMVGTSNKPVPEMAIDIHSPLISPDHSQPRGQLMAQNPVLRKRGPDSVIVATCPLMPMPQRHTE